MMRALLLAAIGAFVMRCRRQRDDATGACCAATATFFSWGPPWRKLHLAIRRGPGRRSKRRAGQSGPGGQNKARSEQETVSGFKPQKAVSRDSTGLIKPLQHDKRAFRGRHRLCGRLRMPRRGFAGIGIDGQHELFQQRAGEVEVGFSISSGTSSSPAARVRSPLSARRRRREMQLASKSMAMCAATGSSVTTQACTMSAVQIGLKGELGPRQALAVRSAPRSARRHRHRPMAPAARSSSPAAQTSIRHASLRTDRSRLKMRGWAARDHRHWLFLAGAAPKSGTPRPDRSRAARLARREHIAGKRPGAQAGRVAAIDVASQKRPAMAASLCGLAIGAQPAVKRIGHLVHAPAHADVARRPARASASSKLHERPHRPEPATGGRVRRASRSSTSQAWSARRSKRPSMVSATPKRLQKDGHRAPAPLGGA